MRYIDTEDCEGDCLAKVLAVKPNEVFVEWWYFAFPPLPYDEVTDNAPCLKCERLSDASRFVLCTFCNRGGCLECFGLDAMPTGDWCCGSCRTFLPSSQRVLDVSYDEWAIAKVDDLILEKDYNPQWVGKDSVLEPADVSAYDPRLMVKTTEAGEKRKRVERCLTVIPAGEL